MIHVLPQWLIIAYVYLLTSTSNKCDSDISSLDINQKLRRCVPVTILLKLEINHVNCHITKSHSVD